MPSASSQDEVNGMALDLAGFWPHWNRSRVGMDMANMLLALAMHIVSLLKNRATIKWAAPANMAFAVFYGGALAACMYWAHRSPKSYARRREVAVTLLPVAAFLAPCTWEVSRNALSDDSLWQAGPLWGTLSFWVALCFATMLPLLVIMGLVWPKRFVWNAAAQALCVGVVLWQAPWICDSPLLRHRASRAQVGHGFSFIEVCSSVALEKGLSQLEAPPDAQCRTLVSVMVLLLGFVLPLVCCAVWQWDAYCRFVQSHSPHGSTHVQYQAPPWWAVQEHVPAEACKQLGACGLFVLVSLLCLYVVLYQ